MKQLVTFFLFNFVSSSLVRASEFETISLGEDRRKVSEQNFTLLMNAEDLYRRKEEIKLARENSLPELNPWRFLKLPAAIFNPLESTDLIQDIVPFLVPGNWFQVRIAKELQKAQEHQYRAVSANALMTATLLFYAAQRDKALLELIEHKKDD